MKKYEGFGNSQFITTDFENYFNAGKDAWKKRPDLYQHNDLIKWKGLPVFIKDFYVESVKNINLNFTALGCIEIFVNGNKLELGEMLPGWSDYNKRTLSIKTDITAYLNKGKNRILAVLSSGWYTGRIAGEYYGNGSPAVLISITDNTTEILSSDNTWKSKICGQIKTADIWDGEYRDNTETSYNEMSLPSFDISNWENAHIFEYKGAVSEFVGPLVKKRDNLALKPANITIYNGIDFNGTYFGKIHKVTDNASLPLILKVGEKAIIDFSQETVGRLNIVFKSETGTKVKMRYSEFLNDSGNPDRGNDGPEGSVYTINFRSALAKAYIISGKEEVTDYSPEFSFFGYRYVEISSDKDIEIIDLTAQIIGNDIKETGLIETSDPDINKLISNIIWGQRSNYLSVPTDCPQRDERLGWTGDAQAFSITAAYNADVYDFFRKWMQDVRDSQSESGGYADVNPRVGYCNSEDACAWGDAGIIIPYNMFCIYGDTTIIEEHFNSMEKYMNGLVNKYGYSGPVPRYGDWLAYDWCDNKFISSAYFIHDCDLMVKMSAAISKKDKSDYYYELGNKARQYFKDNFTDNGILIEKTQTNKIISLAFDLIENKAEVADELEKQIKENGDRLSCGFLGTYNLCPTLSLYSKDKTAYNLLLQRNEPSWLYSVDQGATTIWERWNSYTKENGFGDVGMNSFNHYAYGAIQEWMYRYMAGIEAVAPGFKKIKLQPRIDLRKKDELPKGQNNIKWVKASFNSASGLIKSEWSTENGLIYKCTVPKNVECEVVLPVISDSITINGTEEKISGDIFTRKIGAGEYLFIQ